MGVGGTWDLVLVHCDRGNKNKTIIITIIYFDLNKDRYITKHSRSETIAQRTNQNINKHINYSSKKHTTIIQKQLTERDQEGNNMSKKNPKLN